MSTKSSIILTNDNEHWYKDCAEPLSINPYKTAITLEFSKKNIRIDLNDEEDLVITVTNPDCEIHKLLSDLDKKLTIETKCECDFPVIRMDENGTEYCAICQKDL